MFKKNPYHNPNFDRALYERRLKEPKVDAHYVILFTARSGSSWLTDIVSKTGRLGTPREVFNPGLLLQRAQKLNVSSMDQHVEMLTRRRAHNGVSGFEITYHQLNAVFSNEQQFMDYFGNDAFIWLIRQNIVAQAISLAKLVSTGVGHTTRASQDEIATSDQVFGYDPEEIKKWLLHHRRAEIDTENMIARFNLNPLRLSYERMMRVPVYQLLNVMADHIGTEPIPRKSIVKNSDHDRLATSKSSEFEERFRSDNSAFLDQIDADRKPMLEKLTRLNKTFKSLSLP